MSEANGKVCCNCRHCIRWIMMSGRIKCQCEVNHKWLGYVQVMNDWCRHWAQDKAESEDTDANSD